MTFWEKPNQPPRPWEQPAQEVVLDEDAVAELQEDPNIDIFEEEEEDTALLMADAGLRLEQGRLYQMIMTSDIFGETDADIRAIKNVQREIRRFVRDRMEIMLGIRQEQVAQQPAVSSPFNDMEVAALKMLASKVTKGATEAAPSSPGPAPQPKKDGITPVTGNLRTSASPVLSTPLRKEAKPKHQPKETPAPKQPAKSAVKSEESALKKPIDQMTPEELAAHNKAAEERSASNKAAMPNNLVPHPSPAQLEQMYTMQAGSRGIANPWRVNGQ